MKTTFVITVLFFLFGFTVNAQQEHHYYYKGEKFVLPIDFTRIAVVSEGRFDDVAAKTSTLPPFDIINESISYTRQNVVGVGNKTDNQETIYTCEIRFSTPLAEAEYFDAIRYFKTKNNTIKVLPAYKIHNQRLGISNNFYVKLFKAEDKNILLDMAEKYSMQVLGYNEYMPLWFTLSCQKKIETSPLDAANMFYETGLFDASEPELLYHDLLSSNDTYFPDQWGLKNTGQNNGVVGMDINAEPAWAITTGLPDIKVAVYDHGFEMNHPDLQSNVYGTGFDATTGTAPAQVRGSHGTACAGIVGAQQNNSLGVSGVAPTSKIISVSIRLVTSDTPQQLANGFRWAWQNGADVISCSWGGYAQSSIIENAIDSTLTFGRNGKGTVIVFASGNENNTNIRYPGNSNSDIIVVGAISQCGERKNPNSCDGEPWGSCYGTQLDVVAPGVLIPTTDRQGDNGYNYSGLANDYTNRDYTHWFNGTSSACPHVAGVAALILSVNPTVTQAQVQEIICKSAQKVGGYNYQSGYPYGTWNNEMGYGLVDAYAAIQLACTYPYKIYGTYFYNSATINSCGDIYVKEVFVAGNGNLILHPAGKTFIDGRFNVYNGAQFSVSH